jgi:hypothetical protein
LTKAVDDITDMKILDPVKIMEMEKEKKLNPDYFGESMSMTEDYYTET